MTELELHRTLTYAMFAMGALTLVALFVITAPYGRHARRGWGPTTSARTGWIVMELPAVVLFAAIFAAGTHRADAAPLVLLAIWQLHYIYRALVYPFRLGARATTMPWAIVAMGFSFNVLNAYVNARWISQLGDYPTATLTRPAFVVGALIYLGGLLLNRAADRALFEQRRTSEQRYVIPHGPLFARVSCPNYLGEIIQWFGWALLTWSLAGLAFAVYTFANLGPRALAHHRWYRREFPDYPKPRKALVPFVLCVLVTLAHADEASLLRALDTDDPKALAAAVHAIEIAPTSPELADVLFAAGRACEDRLHDPVRALALYERITRELPDARVAIAAGRRIEMLSTAREHPEQALALAQLQAQADQLSVDELVRRANAVIFPTDTEGRRWLANVLCRRGAHATAQAIYAEIADVRDATSCAIDARDWSLAETLVARLSANEVDRAARADFEAAIARGRLRARLYTASWIGLFAAVALMLASLGEAMLRGGFRAPPWKPPVEVLFLAPVAAVIVLASFTAHRAIAPAVTRITLVGVLLAYVSGIILDLLRARGRRVRARALVHIALCVVGVVSIGYIAMTSDGLLDMLAETVKFGPGA